MAARNNTAENNKYLIEALQYRLDDISERFMACFRFDINDPNAEMPDEDLPVFYSGLQEARQIQRRIRELTIVVDRRRG